jgi:hypothetical protein
MSLSKVFVRKEHPTIAFRDPCQPELLFKPIESEAQIAFIVGSRFVEILYWYLWNSGGKIKVHFDSYLLFEDR